MKRTLNFRLFTLVAAFVIAASSVVSAARMLPDAPDASDSAVYLAAGAAIADLCADLPSTHDHHCPFCHVQADPPVIALSAEGERLFLSLAWQTLTDLSRVPQRGNPHVSARAPPAQA